jgi:hypothetical protein
MRAEQLDDQFAPSISFLFQMLLAQKHLWVQYIPTAVACAWAARRHLNSHVDGTGRTIAARCANQEHTFATIFIPEDAIDAQ